jgi:hypothetical protein
MRPAPHSLNKPAARPCLPAMSAGLLALALAGCGGGQDEGAGARAFASAMAEAAVAAPRATEGRARPLASTIAPVPFTADHWFAWAEQTYPGLFPAGPQTQTVLYAFRSYQVRYYPQQDVHLGVSADGHVYALGAFTQQQLVPYGQLANYACITDPASCQASAEDSVSVWHWAGTRQCQPNDFPARLAALRQQLTDKGFAVTGGQCAWTLESATPAVCGVPDGRMAVLKVPRSEFPRVLGEGWRPFLDGVNGDLNHPVLTPCDRWPPAP